MMRKCTKCGEEKELDCFGITSSKGKKKLRSQCKPCITEGRKSNPERLEKKRVADRERQKRLRVEYPERLKAIEAKRRSSEAHREWTRDYSRKQGRVAIDVRIEANIGSVCLIELVDCFLCKGQSFVRTDNIERKYGRRFCDNCNTKSVRVFGLTLPRSIIKKNCVSCDKEYEGRVGADKRCVDCERKHIRQLRKEARQKQRAAGKHQPSSIRSRARKAGVYMETVIPKKVYERDRYRCVACNCKVVLSKVYQPNQASVDHIIPLSMGGSHTYGNVQTMCVACNSSKSNNITNSVQLTVFDVVRDVTPQPPLRFRITLP